MEDLFSPRNVFIPSQYKIREEGSVLGNVHLEGTTGPQELHDE